MQKSGSNLQNQLESYSVASKGLRAPKNWTGGGTMLATVAGSALALATNANAGIIYSGIQNVSATRPGPAGIGPNLATIFVGGAPWDVYAFNNFVSAIPGVRSGRSTATAALHIVPGFGEGVMKSFANVRKLASGAIISAGQTFGAGFPRLRRKNNFSYTGQFLNSQAGFAGIEFNLGGVAHFGWIRLHSSIGPGNAVTATAIDWAYNDVAGASILAGEGVPSAAPEPSTTSMALLAAGAAGVLAWRKRRKQVAA